MSHHVSQARSGETLAFQKAWRMLQQELDLWADAGMTASFWWRDDDAIASTPQLQILDQLSQAYDIPVSIAVIPARLDPSLVTFLQGRQHITVLQHGYGHTSYAARGRKKIELGGERSLDSIAAELSTGFQQLKGAFPEQFVPAIVPPWNRIEPGVYDRLQAVDLTGISTVRARTKSHAATGILQVNTHLDPISWRHGRGFIGSQIALALLHQHLYLRRTTDRCKDEPTGLLTHHLDQDDCTWAFCRCLFERLNQHPAVHWVSARDIWL